MIRRVVERNHLSASAMRAASSRRPLVHGCDHDTDVGEVVGPAHSMSSISAPRYVSTFMSSTVDRRGDQHGLITPRCARRTSTRRRAPAVLGGIEPLQSTDVSTTTAPKPKASHGLLLIVAHPAARSTPAFALRNWAQERDAVRSRREGAHRSRALPTMSRTIR